MRTPTIYTIATTMALAALITLGAPPAAAQTPDDVIGLYDLIAAGDLGANLDSGAAEHDRPVHNDWPRLTARSAFTNAGEYNASMTQAFTRTPDAVVGFQYNLMTAGDLGTNLRAGARITSVFRYMGSMV